MAATRVGQRAPAVKHTTSKSLQLSAVSAAPFCLGAALFAPSPDGLDGPPTWPCAFRLLTGAPCPGCGATRSIALAAHADERFLEYNPWWVLVLLAGVALGLVGAAVAASVRRLPRVPGRLATVALVATLLVGWVTALVNSSAIAAG